MSVEVLLRRFSDGFDSIIFDVDSTLTTIEGVDELGRMNGVDVSHFTREAMTGSADIRDTYEKRLRAIMPKRDQLEELSEVYIAQEVEDARLVIAALHHAGKEVYFLSNGFCQAITPFATSLSVLGANIFCVRLVFGEDGCYESYDSGILQDGKRAAVRSLKEEGRLRGRILMIGDGVTDLEAKEEVDLFVGYGGVCKDRVRVQEESKIFLWHESLAPVMVLALGTKSIYYPSLHTKGRDILEDPLFTVIK